GWRGDPRRRRAALSVESHCEFERCEQASGLGGTDAGGAEQFGGWPRGEPTQAAAGAGQHAAGDCCGIVGAIAGAEPDGEQFGPGERGGAESPESFARSVDVGGHRGRMIVMVLLRCYRIIPGGARNCWQQSYRRPAPFQTLPTVALGWSVWWTLKTLSAS